MSGNNPQLGAEPVEPFEETQAEKSLRRAKRLAIISLMCGLFSLLINPCNIFTRFYALFSLNYWLLTIALGVVSVILGIIAIYMANPHKGSATRRTTLNIAIIGIVFGILSILAFIYLYIFYTFIHG